MNKILILKLIISLIIPSGLGIIAGLITSQSIPEWYTNLRSPSFNPPNWIFGPVWTVLYLLMGISLFLVWKQEPNKIRNLAIAVFFIHLLLNIGWSFIFFYFKAIGIAFIEIIFLWISIVIMLFLFYKVKPIATYINIPYLLWVTFASVLNGSYYFLNKL